MRRYNGPDVAGCGALFLLLTIVLIGGALIQIIVFVWGLFR